MPIGILPGCACGGVLRPRVVWFGEALPEDILNAALKAAERAGAFTIEINTDATPLSDIMDERLEGRAGEVLPLIVS